MFICSRYVMDRFLHVLGSVENLMSMMFLFRILSVLDCLLRAVPLFGYGHVHFALVCSDDTVLSLPNLRFDNVVILERIAL